MTSLFSTADEHAFDHPEMPSLNPDGNAVAGPSSNGDAVSTLSVEEAFEVEDTVRRITEGGYKTIGLQFPDELLPSSVPVFRAIQRGIQGSSAQAYVLADSTYGSCCPDVLSCLHLPADYLVHYGHACLTPTDALPVHYVFQRQSLDVEEALNAFRAASEADRSERKGTVVVWDVGYDWKAEDIVQRFSAALPPDSASFATIRRPASKSSQTGSSDPAARAGQPADTSTAPLRSVEPPPGMTMSECMIWYIGEEGRGLMNIQMQNADAAIYLYTPWTSSARPLHTTSRALQRRLLSIHSAVTSSIFGLVVHSVGLSSAQPLLAELRALLRQHRKKSYTLTVGRLNPAKLANFETVECFVLVGCREGGLVDSKEFLRPIITPWELILALQGPEHRWEPGRWTLDMSKVLEEAKAARSEMSQNGGANGEEGEEEEDETDNLAPVFSIVDGTYKSRRTFGSRRKGPNGAGETSTGVDGAEDGVRDLTLRSKEFTLAKLESAGSHYLSSRSFQGLEMRYGEDAPAELEEGRSGIARGYTEEK
ncbi:peptidyl-diphthamide biosynthesis [Dioszegia hungarica]|uniref:2-(3-amino-3-carboxypropyl)histidine synthase subunit 2 n=1 Tax=Dioszegia hungarica TaxID=4972 RepID=A0AA38LY30_9TREE|nr:peptidyl-diphthamide biosynthesis [Dioszegia hungarica]KAI9638236.1 peptidyl-diphthamide biosynthesis [Dioszegia hungarica]